MLPQPFNMLLSQERFLANTFHRLKMGSTICSLQCGKWVVYSIQLQSNLDKNVITWVIIVSEQFCLKSFYCLCFQKVVLNVITQFERWQPSHGNTYYLAPTCISVYIYVNFMYRKFSKITTLLLGVYLQRYQYN